MFVPTKFYSVNLYPLRIKIIDYPEKTSPFFLLKTLKIYQII